MRTFDDVDLEGVSANDRYMLKHVRERGRSEHVTFIDEPDPEPIFCPIISADDHLLEPPTLFETRLPAKLREHVPHLEYDDTGLPWWIMDGLPVPVLIVNGASGRDKREWGLLPATYDDFRAGVYDSAARLPDMDMCGVWGSLCFPSVIWGFAGSRLAQLKDAAVGLACVKAYNDWMLEEWCAAAPERYIPCQLPWLADPQLAADEIYRNAARGFRSVSFSENPETLGMPTVYNTAWDPFFRACEETETVINLHVGSSGNVIVPTSDSADGAPVALFPVSGLVALVDWVFAKVPLRFPNIKIALSEAGVSWLPMALERLRRAHRLQGGIGNQWPTDAPTQEELALRNFYFTSIEDPAAFRLLDLIDEDKIMVETDYPHFDSTWPECQAMIRAELQHLPVETIRKVCYGNAARLYQRGLPPQEMIDKSSHTALAHANRPA